jgi:hypothetical protein
MNDENILFDKSGIRSLSSNDTEFDFRKILKSFLKN